MHSTVIVGGCVMRTLRNHAKLPACMLQACACHSERILNSKCDLLLESPRREIGGNGCSILGGGGPTKKSFPYQPRATKQDSKHILTLVPTHEFYHLEGRRSATGRHHSWGIFIWHAIQITGQADSYG